VIGFERYAALGGSVGAIGVVAAIFAAWLFAQPERLQDRRLEDRHVNGQLRLIGNTVSQFDLLGPRTHTRTGAMGRMGRGVAALLNFEPRAFLSLYKIAHSESMVDKWDNFAFRLLHNQRSPLRTRGH
jgi:hypothetical protein